MKVELNLNIPELPRPDGGDYNLTADVLKYFLNNAKIDRSLNHYLKDKSVIIVGPASYMKDSGKGEFIESHDIIIRCNGFWKPDSSLYKDVGKRTNIRWHSGAEFPSTGGMWNIKDMIDYGVEYVCIQYPKYLDYFHYDIKKFENLNEEYNLPFHYWSDLELYLSFHHYLGTRMQLGMAAVTDLMFYDLKSLHISGFSFHANIKEGIAGDYIEGAKPAGYVQNDYNKTIHSFVNHAQIPQMKLLREFMNLDSRLTIDSETDQILQGFNI